MRKVFCRCLLTGGEEVEDGEEEEEEAQIPVTDKLATSPGEKTLFSIEERSPESKETDAMGNMNFILISSLLIYF
ncbi:hypothetical protein cypCar_00029864 [Cyprinus carpio]|nr:hypothetical protein cypCar_00029864 [Cyprinus carpio]